MNAELEKQELTRAAGRRGGRSGSDGEVVPRGSRRTKKKGR